ILDYFRKPSDSNSCSLVDYTFPLFSIQSKDFDLPNPYIVSHEPRLRLQYPSLITAKGVLSKGLTNSSGTVALDGAESSSLSISQALTLWIFLMFKFYQLCIFLFLYATVATSVFASATKFHQFFSEEGWDSFKQIFDNYMFELLRKWKEAYEGSLFENLCKALNLIVKSTATILNLMLTHFLREEPCKIFLLWSVHGFGIKLPFYEQGFLCFARWSFTFFFYNRKLKRVVSFRLCQIRLSFGITGFCFFLNLVAEHFPMEDKKILMKWVSELET
ncbi:hypothetical protein RJ641_006849, partial [Dillenia turbinata]